MKLFEMKPLSAFIALMIISSLFSCSKDEDVSPSKLNHVGEKWKITSVDYTIVDQSLSNPANWVQTGTANNAGTFYFDGSQGSFDILINDQREEDYFGYTNDNGSISIITIEQSISPTRFSQSVIAFSGDQQETTIEISGTFTKQGGVSQYVFAGDFVLTKE
jgi:hypothetical protein